MTETLTDKPWRYDGFGCIRCGRHVVLQLPPNLADEVSPEDLVRIGRTAAAATRMLEILHTIVMNARIIPDATMAGATDICTIPLDDIAAIKRIIEELYVQKET